MKKKNIFLLLIVLLLVGCKSQKLSCTKDIMKTQEATMDERISLTFKNKKLTDTIYSLNYTFADNVDSNVETSRNALEEQYSIYKNSKGIKYSFSNMDQGLHFQLEIAKEKLSDEEKETFSNLVNYKTYQDAKEQLIKEGYQCK